MHSNFDCVVITKEWRLYFMIRQDNPIRTGKEDFLNRSGPISRFSTN